MTRALDQSVLSAVIAVIRGAFFLPDVEIVAETRFSEDLGFDSLDLMEVVMAVEEKLDMEFSRDAIRCFRQVSDIVVHLSRRFFRDVSELTLAQAA